MVGVGTLLQVAAMIAPRPVPHNRDFGFVSLPHKLSTTRTFPVICVSTAVHQLWNKVVAFMEAASKQRHMIALRDGMIGSIPIILVGSMFLCMGAQSQLLEAIPGV